MGGVFFGGWILLMLGISGEFCWEMQSGISLGGKNSDHLFCRLHGEGRLHRRLSLGAELKKVL